MGIKKFFKGPKPPPEMTQEQTREVLLNNGVTLRNAPNERKFKFGEFSKYTKEKSETMDPNSHLKPRLPGQQGSNGGYGSSSSGSGYESDPYKTQQGVYGSSRFNQNQNQNANFNGQKQQSAPSSSAPAYDPYNSQQPQQYQQSVYDPYATDKDPYAQSIGHRSSAPNRSQQAQVTKPHEQKSYDPYEAEQDIDLNDYPGASGGQQQQESSAYDPYSQHEAYQDQEEIDSEEEEINRIVRQTKDVRGDTVKSTQNILTHLRGADDTGANVIGALGSQREKMYRIENNLNAMESQQRYVDVHVKELEHYNRSLFHIKTSNPFTKKSKIRAAERQTLANKHADRDRDSELNSTLYQTQKQLGGQLKDDPDFAIHSELKEKYDYDKRVKDASKYLTEDHDEEDERMEVEYSRNIDEAQVLASRLKQKANIISSEIDTQNTRLRAISEKVNKTDDKLTISTNRIRGI